jgi:hypothetical protein
MTFDDLSKTIETAGPVKKVLLFIVFPFIIVFLLFCYLTESGPSQSEENKRKDVDQRGADLATKEAVEGAKAQMIEDDVSALEKEKKDVEQSKPASDQASSINTRYNKPS